MAREAFIARSPIRKPLPVHRLGRVEHRFFQAGKFGRVE